MNALQEILKTKVQEFSAYVTLPDSHYYMYEDERMIDEDWVNGTVFDRYTELVDFSSLGKIAAKGELSPDLFKLQVEKKILTSVKSSLEDSIERNKWFHAKTNWKPLDQLLTLFRLKELKSAGITRRGGRGKGKSFDVSTLAATFFGKQILKGLEMGRRRLLNQEELDSLKAECAKLKLTLPEVTEPTTTERFFADEVADAS